jgi:hypothetical protein
MACQLGYASTTLNTRESLNMMHSPGMLNNHLLVLSNLVINTFLNFFSLISLFIRFCSSAFLFRVVLDVFLLTTCDHLVVKHNIGWITPV